MNIANLFTVEAIISKSGFQDISASAHVHNTHKTIDLSSHFNLYNPSPYCFYLLVVPIPLEELSTMLIIIHQKVCNHVIFPAIVHEGLVISVPIHLRV